MVIMVLAESLLRDVSNPTAALNPLLSVKEAIDKYVPLLQKNMGNF